MFNLVYKFKLIFINLLILFIILIISSCGIKHDSGLENTVDRENATLTESDDKKINPFDGMPESEKDIYSDKDAENVSYAKVKMIKKEMTFIDVFALLGSSRHVGATSNLIIYRLEDGKTLTFIFENFTDKIDMSGDEIVSELKDKNSILIYDKMQ